ncbi:MAG: class I tRNA ligase family protein, partial [Burkholderiaceae bacterium]|nr:class I tRNA ligase family protein [Burkholderiaceae bacterium]
MMAIELYSTLTRQKAAFKPLTENEVKMYVCGVTVYDYTHIGHGRTFISFDIIRRWLEARGFKVTFVRNITDVDDKIIRRAAERKVTCDELTAEFGKAMQDDMIALGCLPPTHEPRATHFIPQMLNIIDRLQANGLAYQTESGDVAYNVRGFNGYGKLSGKDIDDLRSGERVAADQTKRDPLDFVLWKSAKPGEPQWDSKWGSGRPGWHIECSAMSCYYLGETFDI